MLTQPDADFWRTKEADTREMLRSLRNHHFVVAIHPDGRPLEGWAVNVSDPTDWGKSETRIEQLNEDGYNIYWTSNPVRDDFDGPKPKKNDIAAVSVLQADCDPIPTEGSPHAEAVERALQGALSFAQGYLVPTIAIHSGNGCQFVWRLSEPVTVAEGETLCKRLNAALNQVEGVSCKGTHNADRLLRLPGTKNWPNPSKLKKGYDPSPVEAKILKTNPEAVLDLVQLDEVTPRAGPEASRTATVSDASAEELGITWPPEEPSDHMKRLHEDWREHPHYDGLIKGTHKGRSEALMGIMSWHKRMGLTAAQSAALVGHDGGVSRGHVEDQANPERALARAWTNSEAFDPMAALNEMIEGAVYDPRTEQAPWEAQLPDTLIKSSGQFASEMKPPSYLIRRLSLQRGQLLTLTAHPGHFKTGVAMELAFRLAQGLSVDGSKVKPGRVLFLAGENNEDNRLRFRQTCLDHGVDPSEVQIDWVDGSFPLSEICAKRIKEEIRKRGPYDLVVVDTAVAYYDGEDENNNAEIHRYYQTLRGLTRVKGGPLVIVLTHPAKNAKADELLPRGGSAAYGTIDGNMTLAMGNGIARLHHGKWRGQPFAPLYWRPKPLKHPSVVDSDGVQMPSVRAEEVPQSDAKQIEGQDERRVLSYLRDNPKPSQREWAEAANISRSGLWRILKELAKAGEVKSVGKGRSKKYLITPNGCDRLDGKSPTGDATEQDADTTEPEDEKMAFPDW